MLFSSPSQTCLITKSFSVLFVNVYVNNRNLEKFQEILEKICEKFLEFRTFYRRKVKNGYCRGTDGFCEARSFERNKVIEKNIIHKPNIRR